MQRPSLIALVCIGAAGAAQAANLLDVYNRALDTDPLWHQASFTRLATHESKTQAVLGLLPLDISANKNFVGIGSVPIKTPAYLGATLSLNVFNWDNWVALKAADATVAQAEANYQAAPQNLIQRVSQQYFAVLAAQDTLTAQQSALQSVQTQLDQAEQRYRLGLIASRMGSDVAHDSLLTAYGGHLPTVNINVSRNWALERGNYSSNVSSTAGEAAQIGSINGVPTMVNTSDVFWSIGISVPLFSAGLTQSRVRQARYSWDAAKAGLDYTTRQTEEQTREAYQGVISQIAQVQALRQAVESDRIALQATEAGYQVGTKAVVDVLTSRAALLQDDTNYAQAKYAYLNGIVSLRLAAGNLDRSTVELINSWLIEPRPPPAPPQQQPR